jgi:hypothetical protein
MRVLMATTLLAAMFAGSTAFAQGDYTITNGACKRGRLKNAVTIRWRNATHRRIAPQIGACIIPRQ